jgi:toxin ParE1/3/4
LSRVVAKYRLTPRAEADRDRIIKEGLPEWGKRQVAEYLDELQACLERLAEYPGLGQACDEIRPGYRSLPFGAHYVYYRADKAGVVIVRIRPQRMLPRKHMLGEESAQL